MAENENIPAWQDRDTHDNELAAFESTNASDAHLEVASIADQRARIRAELEPRYKSGQREGDPIPCDATMATIFTYDPELCHLGINTMAEGLAWRDFTPSWRTVETGLEPDTDAFFSAQDEAHVDAIVRHYFSGRPVEYRDYRNYWAQQRRFSPVKDYLEKLPPWDGIERIATCLPVEDSEYTHAVLTNVFLSFMQRTYESGCQVDSMVVLVGEQGLRKTTWLRAILPMAVTEIGDIPVGQQHKDTLISCHRAAIVLLDEVDKFYKRADQSDLKAFLTQRVDSWRAPYARTETISARSFILVGTTNEKEFLQDLTGNRRYWPLVITERIADEYLSREWMDLLLAEALARYRAGERMRYDSAFDEMARAVQAQHLDDPVGDAVRAWLDYPLVETEKRDPYGNKTTEYSRVDVSRVSIGMLCKFVPELKKVDSVRDKKTARAIQIALDSHPRYRRMDGATSYRVNGLSARIAWEVI